MNCFLDNRPSGVFHGTGGKNANWMGVANKLHRKLISVLSYLNQALSNLARPRTGLAGAQLGLVGPSQASNNTCLTSISFHDWNGMDKLRQLALQRKTDAAPNLLE